MFIFTRYLYLKIKASHAALKLTKSKISSLNLKFTVPSKINTLLVITVIRIQRIEKRCTFVTCAMVFYFSFAPSVFLSLVLHCLILFYL